jgi:hypothetical protein
LVMLELGSYSECNHHLHLIVLESFLSNLWIFTSSKKYVF